MFSKINRLLDQILRAPNPDRPHQPFGPNAILFVRRKWSGVYLEIVISQSRFTLGFNCFGDPFFDVERFAGKRLQIVCYGSGIAS